MNIYLQILWINNNYLNNNYKIKKKTPVDRQVNKSKKNLLKMLKEMSNLEKAQNLF